MLLKRRKPLGKPSNLNMLTYYCYWGRIYEKEMYLATNATAVLLHQPYLDEYFITEINIEHTSFVQVPASSRASHCLWLVWFGLAKDDRRHCP